MAEETQKPKLNLTGLVAGQPVSIEDSTTNGRQMMYGGCSNHIADPQHIFYNRLFPGKEDNKTIVVTIYRDSRLKLVETDNGKKIDFNEGNYVQGELIFLKEGDENFEVQGELIKRSFAVIDKRLRELEARKR